MQLDYVGASPIRPHGGHDDNDDAVAPKTAKVSKFDKSIELSASDVPPLKFWQ